MSSDYASGSWDLRRVATSRPDGCCKGLQGELQQIHTVARQLFEGVLARPTINPTTLFRMRDSIERQIEAGRDLEERLIACSADAATRNELTQLLTYFGALADRVAARLGPAP